MKGIFLICLFIFLAATLAPNAAYEILGKNNRAYYYSNKKRHWDDNAYKSYYYYDKEVYPQYTYTYPGHYYYYGYPNYYHNDRGAIYSYWGY